MNQGDMFQSDTSQLAARLFFKDEAMTRPESRPKITDNLQTYAREAQKNTVGDRLFADDVAPKDVLKSTVDRGAADTNVHDLFSKATDPALADKAMTDPKVQDAAGAELQRMMERGDNQFVKADGSKGVIDAELHDIEQTLAAAKEISACTNYSVAAE
ncbi:MAG: hypothetical protein JO051_06415 [Acidobacteriaceae bacterium]|nr:hypothetical protein [Acidobacteriaceae bacterium]